MATLPFDGKPLTIAIDQRHVVQLPARILRVRLTGMLFETDKTFLLPKAMHGIRGLVDLYEEHPDMDVVITGHTDRVGDPSYNLGLSDERARAIAAYLRDDVDTWVEWYSQHPFSRAWGTREDQHMLGAVIDDASGDPFYTGSVHGQLDAETQEAAKRFQASRGLTVDGIPGPQTRRALITSYMQLDGTTLPPNTNVTLYPNGQSVCALTFRLSRTSRGVRFTVDCECDWDRISPRSRPPKGWRCRSTSMPSSRRCTRGRCPKTAENDDGAGAHSHGPARSFPISRGRPRTGKLSRRPRLVLA